MKSKRREKTQTYMKLKIGMMLLIPRKKGIQKEKWSPKHNFNCFVHAVSIANTKEAFFIQ